MGMELSSETSEASPGVTPPPTMTHLGDQPFKHVNLSNHHAWATEEDAASNPRCSFITALAVGGLSLGLVMNNKQLKNFLHEGFPVDTGDRLHIMWEFEDESS